MDGEATADKPKLSAAEQAEIQQATLRNVLEQEMTNFLDFPTTTNAARMHTLIVEYSAAWLATEPFAY